MHCPRKFLLARFDKLPGAVILIGGDPPVAIAVGQILERGERGLGFV